MYPLIETDRLLLKPLQENDLDNMYTLYANLTVAPTMEYWDSILNFTEYKKEFANMVSYDGIFTIRLKESD